MKKYISFFFLCFALMFSAGNTYAQCTIKKRVYANNQKFKGEGVLAIPFVTSGLAPGTISNASQVIDGNMNTFSSLSVPIALNIFNLGILRSNATQFLEFKSGSNYIPANTPVTIKLGLPTSLLGLLDNIELQPFNSLTGSATNGSATAVGSAFQSSSLINLVNGSGVVELTITPAQQYQGVWVKLGSTLSLGLHLDIYHAYILEEHTAPAIDCDAPIDILYGVKAGAAGGLLNASGSVNDPEKAKDNDVDSYAQLNVGVQLLSEVFETVIFNTPSQENDVVEIIIQKSDGSLLDLNLLTGFSIQPFLGSVAGSPLSNTNTFLSLSLLSGSAGNAKYLLRAKIPTAFDRVEIKMGGIAGALSTLRIYDVKRKILPAILSGGVEISNATLCEGESITLNINPQPCTVYKWYDVPTGGVALHTGVSYLVSNVTTTKTYYVEAERNNVCNNKSERVPVTINVNPAPSILLGTMPSVCELITQAILPFSNPVNTPTEYKIVWSQLALDAGFVNIEQALSGNSQIEINIPKNLTPTIYNGSLTVKNANNCISTSQNIQVTVKPTPDAPILNIQTHSQY